MVACLFLVAAPGVHAVSASEASVALSEQDYLGNLPVVLSATRLAQPLAEAPAAISVLDRQMIEASGARTIPDLFRLVPGMTVAQASGHRYAVSYHGLIDEYSRRMQVLVDGRSIYLPSFGGVSWMDLPLAIEDIERIEVIRGPNAATYGANSFQGVISIITRHAALDQGVSARIRAGTHDVRDGVFGFGGGEGALKYHVTAGYEQDDGFDARNDSRRTSMLRTRIDYDLDARTDLDVQFGFLGGPRGRGFVNNAADPFRNQGIDSHYEQVRWRRATDDAGEWLVQAYHNYHVADEDFSTDPIPVPGLGTVVLPLTFDVTSQRFDLEIQRTHAPHPGVRFVWGAGARLDRVKWPSFLGTPEWVDNHLGRLFADAEWHPAARLVLNAGAMVEHSEISGTDFAPRLAANYHLRPGHTLRYGWSRAARTPVLLEERSYAKFCVDPACTIFDQTFASLGGLKSEKVTANDIGYIGQLGDRTEVDVRLFHERLTNLIGMYHRPFPNIDGDAHDFRGLDRATVRGFEGRLDWKPGARDRIVFNYAYTDIDSTDIDVRYSASAPRHSASVLAMHSFSGSTHGSVAWYFTGRTDYAGGDELGPSRRLDLRLAHALGGRRRGADVALVVQNALDDYAEFARENRFDTRVYVTLGLRLY